MKQLRVSGKVMIIIKNYSYYIQPRIAYGWLKMNDLCCQIKPKQTLKNKHLT